MSLRPIRRRSRGTPRCRRRLEREDSWCRIEDPGDQSFRKYVEQMVEYQQAWQMPAPQKF